MLLVDAGGTERLSELSPATGTTATLAAIAILLAAATKSAQVPFHVWLPGAMVAPTPVSAYLHSATMVKAGVLLVAIAAPALAATEVWTPLGLAFGITSMIWGSIGALRHVDAKLILAWGTVSQLGLMITLLVLDDPKATLAGISMLFAHAIFKAALFMVVGEIDVRTGTRDISRLGGLRTTMPVAFWVAVISGASMAGLPPMLGFATKEAAVEAVIKLSGAELWVASIGVLGGSVLTVAYTGRLLMGLFGGEPRPAASDIAAPRFGLAAPSVVLSVITVGGFVLLDAVDDLAGRAAAELDPRTVDFSLIRWPGFDSTALWFSTAIIVSGSILAVVLARRDGTVPRTLGADAVDGLLDGVLVVSRRVAATFQHGSLPIYVATMAATAAVATIPFAFSIDLDAITRWDDPLQAALVVAVVASSLAMLTVRTRLGAAIGLGAVGIAIAGIFVVHGAPDLALTQLLVETVVVVGFVIGLGQLARNFPTTGEMWRGVRIGVAAATALAVAAALASSASDPVAEPPIDELTERAVDDGGGNNVVNVILTDIRALDTFGEIMVLVVVSIGIIALARANRQEVTS
ncbi:MAG: hydrogen gas-evolving membrane-bound hydrogenase subunit E [Actinomycetota bacterium]